MAASDDRPDPDIAELANRVRDQLARELEALLRHARSKADAERDDAAARARNDAEAAAAARITNAISVEKAAAEARVAQASIDVRGRERQSMLAEAERLLASIKSIDAAGSLSDTLDALTRAAAGEAGRAALLIRRGPALKGWALEGFGNDAPDAKSIELALDEAGLLADALEHGERQTTGGEDRAERAHIPAPFTPSSSDRVGLAIPLIVDRHAVAVLYADAAGEQETVVPSAWPEHVEILARHAARALEALTARQTGRDAAAIAADRAKPDAEGARRFARLLISEIKLYHEAQVDEGRRSRDLLHRLQPHIDRARMLYEERVPPEVRGSADYFNEELVRTLADGDPVLLGRAS